MRAWFLAGILAVVALAPVFLLLYYYTKGNPQPGPTIADVQFEPETPRKLEAGQELVVKACKVIDGYRFEMYLEGKKWMESQLAVAAKDEASAVVVELLTKTTPPPPTVTLLRQVGHVWIVDFHLNVDGKRVNLVDHLRSKGLLLN